MTSAAVGFQCPSCIAEGKAAVRSPQNLLGGRLEARPRVTMVLIGANVAIFLVGLLLGTSQQFIQKYGMQPLAIAADGEWYRLITSAFLHGGLLHIGFNMYVLWILGPVLERAMGSVRFVVLYLVAALGGSVASYATSPPNTLSVGASGAIFGLMAALLVVGHRFRHDVSQVAVLLAVNFAIGFIYPGIDWRAHVGGALTGAAVAAVMAYAPRSSRVLWQTLGVLLVLFVLVMITITRTTQLQQLASALLG
jgi:membrane associated rhomboid family serine protease